MVGGGGTDIKTAQLEHSVIKPMHFIKSLDTTKKNYRYGITISTRLDQVDLIWLELPDHHIIGLLLAFSYTLHLNCIVFESNIF